MASDTENRDQQKDNTSDNGSTGSHTTLTSDSYLHSGLLDTRDSNLDKAHDYHLQQDKGISSEQVHANLHLHSTPDHVVPGAAQAPASISQGAEFFGPDQQLRNEVEERDSSELLFAQSASLQQDDAEPGPSSNSEPFSEGGAAASLFQQSDMVPQTETKPDNLGAVENNQPEDISTELSDETPPASLEDTTVSEQSASDLSAVSDANDAKNTIAEDAAAGSASGIQASAEVNEGSTVRYRLLDDADGLFAIDPESGIVTVAGELDAETAGAHTIVVLATASDGETQTETFTITIQDIDEYDVSSIEETGDSVDQITENATGGTTGLVVSAEDRYFSDTVSYAIDDQRFEIDADGVVSITADAVFDAEMEETVSFSVTATSSDGSETSQFFTLSISDVNEYATTDFVNTDASENTVTEDAAAGTQVGITALATDEDVTDSVAYSVSDTRFEVAEDGTVTVASGASFDAETEGSTDVTVTATSSDGSTSQETLTVAISDVNESSVSVVSDEDASANSISENATAGTQVGITAQASDSESSDSITYSVSDIRFSVDGNGVVTIADHVFFDGQEESSVDLTITATSSDGSESTETLSINVSGDYDYEFTGGTGNGNFNKTGESMSVDGIGGNDNISTGDDGDRIEGGSIAGADTISGNGGRDLLFGEGGQDMISGSAGDDVIIGGADADNLVGGDGSELFMYGLGDGDDTISGGAGAAWTDVLDLGGGPGVTAAGDYGTDWTVTITEGSIETTDLENGKLDLTEDASGTIEFLDGSKVDFTEIEEIRWS